MAHVEQVGNHNDVGVDQTLTLTDQQKLVPVGFANVNADGSIASSFGSPVSVLSATGRYQFTTIPTGAITATVSTVESFTTRDSVTARMEDFVGGFIHITEGDNSTTANIPVNRPFTIVWYGLEDDLVDVTIS